jgi:tRNA(Ile2) C34 agmatinyltransferase TiaS
MFRKAACLASVLLIAGSIHSVSAQTTAAPEAKPSKMKLTVEKIKAMKAKWSANKPKMKACRGEAKSKGLAGDDRWFFMEDCMNKS